jgi:hypothetical protein
MAKRPTIDPELLEGYKTVEDPRKISFSKPLLS